MMSTNRLLLFSLAALIAGAACSKKKSDSPAPAAPAAASNPTPATTLTNNGTSPLVLKRNADGSAQVEVTLVDGNGLRTVLKGRITPQGETEIRSDDGKSMAAVRAYDNYAFVMLAQYQVDRSDARVSIFAGNPKDNFDLILNGLVLERNGALAKVDNVLGEVAGLCSYNGPQALAAMSEFFRANPSGSLDQFVESKRQEIKDSGSDRQCVSANLSTDPNDGHVRVHAGDPNPTVNRNHPSRGSHTNGSSDDLDVDEPLPPSKRPSNGPYDDGATRPPQSGSTQQAPCPPQQQAPGQPPYQQPPYQQPPAQQAPPSAQQPPYQPPYQPYPPVQPPSAQQPYPPVQQPPAQQAPPQAQQGSPEQQVGNGDSAMWEACYAAGKWKTKENYYCRQKWWKGCSPETGGTVCHVKGSKDSDDSSHASVSEPSTPAQTGSASSKSGEWTEDFNVCYAAGKWKTDGNNYCKQWFWPNCSPDRGANRCMPQP